MAAHRALSAGRGVAALTAAVAAAATLSGCGGEVAADRLTAPAGGMVVFVVGGHALAPRQALTGQAAAAVDLAVTQGASVSVVVADGAPHETFSADLSGPRSAAERAADRDRLTAAIAGASAGTPQTDLLGALRLAGSRMADHAGLHTVVIADSGLSTTGAVDFEQGGMVDADPTYVADTLGDTGALPNLGNALVVSQGLGETTAPQQPLDTARRARLQAIWRLVVERAGASTVESEPVSGTTAPVGVPEVSTVAVPPDVTCSGTEVVLSGGRLAFPPDSDIYLDLAAAKDALRPLAAQIVGRQLTAVLSGGVPDTGTPAGRAKLSENQAQAAANVLLGLGVLIPQLHVVGLGSNFPGFVPDRDPAGRLLPAAAAANTKVFVHLSGPVSCG